MAIFNSYVKLPEGNRQINRQSGWLILKITSPVLSHQRLPMFPRRASVPWRCWWLAWCHASKPGLAFWHGTELVFFWGLLGSRLRSKGGKSMTLDNTKQLHIASYSYHLAPDNTRGTCVSSAYPPWSPTHWLRNVFLLFKWYHQFVHIHYIQYIYYTHIHIYTYYIYYIIYYIHIYTYIYILYYIYSYIQSYPPRIISRSSESAFARPSTWSDGSGGMAALVPWHRTTSENWGKVWRKRWFNLVELWWNYLWVLILGVDWMIYWYLLWFIEMFIANPMHVELWHRVVWVWDTAVNPLAYHRKKSGHQQLINQLDVGKH